VLAASLQTAGFQVPVTLFQLTSWTRLNNRTTMSPSGRHHRRLLRPTPGDMEMHTFVCITYSRCILHAKLIVFNRRRKKEHPVCLVYQPLANSTFLSEQTSQQQSASSTFLSEKTSTSHQAPAKRTGWRPLTSCTVVLLLATMCRVRLAS
jgi:hypothetical protein